MTWIRVNTGVDEEPRTWELRERLGIELVAAVGLITLVGCRVAEHCPDGRIERVPDGLLEAWARWHGEPGTFARAYRSIFAPHGEILDWSDRMGQLVQRLEKDRDRKRKKYEREPTDAQSTDSPLKSPRTFRGESEESPRHERTNETDETIISLHPSTPTPEQTRQRGRQAPEMDELLDRFPEECRSAVLNFFELVPALKEQDWRYRVSRWLAGKDLWQTDACPSPREIAFGLNAFCAAPSPAREALGPAHVFGYIADIHRRVQGLPDQRVDRSGRHKETLSAHA